MRRNLARVLVAAAALLGPRLAVVDECSSSGGSIADYDDDLNEADDSVTG